MSIFPLRFNNFIVKEKKHDYKTWWNLSIKMHDTNYWDENTKNIHTHGDYVSYFYYAIVNEIKKAGYTIKDEKQFKREIATFIYQLSSEK